LTHSAYLHVLFVFFCFLLLATWLPICNKHIVNDTSCSTGCTCFVVAAESVGCRPSVRRLCRVSHVS